MTKYFAFLIFIQFTLSSCESICSTEEPTLTVTFRDSTGYQIDPEFDYVHGLGKEQGITILNQEFLLPLNLSEDESIYLFEKDGQVDTLGFSYSRELREGERREGHCVALGFPRKHPSTTFQVYCFVFTPNPNHDYCTNEEFTAIISY